MPDARPAVLVVDDDAAIRKLLTTILTREGFLVVTASNGREAIDMIECANFRAIILDLMMPLLDGFDAIQHLERRHGDLAKECVIVLTAASPRELAKLDEHRVFCVIRKPFDIDALVETVRRCVSASEALRLVRSRPGS